MAVTNSCIGDLSLLESVLQLVHDEDIFNGFMRFELVQRSIEILQQRQHLRAIPEVYTLHLINNIPSA